MYHDAHVHLVKSKMYSQLLELRENWIDVGVSSLQVMSMTLSESYRSLHLYEPDIVLSGVGKHPWKVKRPLTAEEQTEFEMLVKDRRCKVIGEVGLDYHFIRNPERFTSQQETFEFFVNLSLETKKPLNIHLKGAEEDVLEILQNHGVDGALVNIHWFSGSSDILEKLATLGCYFSIGPAVYYSTHRLVAKTIDLDHLLTESDGDTKYKPLNLIGEPAIIPFVVEKIAEIKGKPLKDVRNQIWENVNNFLRI